MIYAYKRNWSTVGMVGGSIGSLLGEAHRRAARTCNQCVVEDGAEAMKLTNYQVGGIDNTTVIKLTSSTGVATFLRILPSGEYGRDARYVSLDPAGNRPCARCAITNYDNGGRHPIGKVGVNGKIDSSLSQDVITFKVINHYRTTRRLNKIDVTDVLRGMLFVKTTTKNNQLIKQLIME